MKHIIKVFLIASLILSRNVSLHAETINLSVAASMTDAFKEIIAVYSKDHSDTKIQTNFGSSGSLAKQINQGAPADLYVSANPKWMEFLLEHKAISPSNKRVIGYNKLVFIGQEGLPISRLSDLSSLQKISIGSPSSVPAGQYAQQAMENAGVYSSLKQQRKFVMAKDTRQALLYADRGEVDGGFVYKTDALLAENATILFVVPDALYDRVSYLLALTISGAERPAVTELYKYLATKQVRQILVKHGFEPTTE